MSNQIEKPTNDVRLWVFIVTFFLIGALVGIPVVVAWLDAGLKTTTAIAFGAIAGGVAAWLLFFIGANVWKALSRPRKDA